MSTPLPVYDPAEPSQNQDDAWDCSQESAQWCLNSWGRNPDDGWMTQCLLDEGVVSAQYGLMDASGAGMADWFNRWYSEDGYVASNEPSVTFDQLAVEAFDRQHPLMIGGRSWCHWVGLSGYSIESDLLLIKNSAPGYLGVWDTLSRSQFAALGSFSMVRLTHPGAEGELPMEPESPPLDYSFWETDGRVGSGLIELMRADGVQPAQDYSTWLPLGRHPAQIEECLAEDGTVYRWLLTTSMGYRYRPSG